MDAQGLTQDALAEKAGVSMHTIFRAVSKGSVPRGGNISKIAAALGVSQADLFMDPNANVTPANLGKSELVLRLSARLHSLDESELRALETVLEGFLELRGSRGQSSVG